MEMRNNVCYMQVCVHISLESLTYKAKKMRRQSSYNQHRKVVSYTESRHICRIFYEFKDNRNSRVSCRFVCFIARAYILASIIYRNAILFKPPRYLRTREVREGKRRRLVCI
uniref:Ovule protein n=1 Tax=Ascaris lumbricoides TaxID=6252 RepID=A0A0M3HK56_ASCLU